MSFEFSLCVDANVFVSAIDPSENQHAASLLFLEKALDQENDFFEPELVIFEVCHAFYRKFQSAEISQNIHDQFVDYFYKLPLILQWRKKVMKRAMNIARRLSYRGIADCAYLSVAQSHKIDLITWDEDLIRRGRKVYKKILTPQQFLDTFDSFSSLS